MSKKAFIIGITGQDGAYLSRFLLDKNYLVYGYTRSVSKKNLLNLNILKTINNVKIYQYLESNPKKILNDIKRLQPNEIYYFSGQSSVKESFKNPIQTYDSNLSTLYKILELLRINNLKKIKIYNSSSTDCFGNNAKIFNKEKDIFKPMSPYARAKSFSFWLMKYYREVYRLHSKNGILSNHESPLRPDKFVISKVINHVKNKKKTYLKLGNIDVYRDWGWAPDYVEAIYKINTAKKAKDYVVGTGKITSLKTIINKIFIMTKTHKKYLKKNLSTFIRPSDVLKIGTNPEKLKKELKWKTKVNLDNLIKKMYLNELY
tara:strand:- start:202 stop:1152 length:951 start_codon:yes stop_codon:yes gene_type:complete